MYCFTIFSAQIKTQFKTVIRFSFSIMADAPIYNKTTNSATHLRSIIYIESQVTSAEES